MPTPTPLPKTVTDEQILKGYASAEGKKQSELAADMGIDRQRLSHYWRGLVDVPVGLASDLFRANPHDYIREMALDLLVRKPLLDRPCYCMEYIGDNGPCPRHSATLEGSEHA